MTSMFCFQCEQTAKGQGCTISGVCGKKAEENKVLKNVVTFIKKDYGNNLEEIPEIQVDLNQGGKKVYRSNKLNKLR